MRLTFLAGMALVLLPAAILRGADRLIALPDPAPPSPGSLEDTLNRARTGREYSSRPVALEDLARVLWVGGGSRYDALSGASSRTYPSAGNIYPTRLYVVVGEVVGLEPGVYEYPMTDHELKLLRAGDQRKALVEGSGQAGWAAFAPVAIVLAADYAWTTTAFGERGRNLYIGLDAGHVSQNLRLEATAAGLAIGMAGQFDHAQAQRVIGITDEPLLILGLGYCR